MSTDTARSLFAASADCQFSPRPQPRKSSVQYAPVRPRPSRGRQSVRRRGRKARAPVVTARGRYLGIRVQRPDDFDAFWSAIMRDCRCHPPQSVDGPRSHPLHPRRSKPSRSATTAWTASGSPAGTAVRRRLYSLPLSRPADHARLRLRADPAKVMGEEGLCGDRGCTARQTALQQPVQPRLSRPAGPRHRRSQHLLLSRLLRRRRPRGRFHPDSAGG